MSADQAAHADRRAIGDSRTTGLASGRMAGLAVVVAALVVLGGLLLVRGALAPPAPPEILSVLIDAGQATVTMEAPPANAAAIAHDEALRRAGGLLMSAGSATSVEARQVQLTLAGSDGTVLVQPRHVWLVTYRGAEYSVNTGCTCYTQSQPNTAVVLDARTGQSLLTFGAP